MKEQLQMFVSFHNHDGDSVKVFRVKENVDARRFIQTLATLKDQAKKEGASYLIQCIERGEGVPKPIAYYPVQDGVIDFALTKGGESYLSEKLALFKIENQKNGIATSELDLKDWLIEVMGLTSRKTYLAFRYYNLILKSIVIFILVASIGWILWSPWMIIPGLLIALTLFYRGLYVTIMPRVRVFKALDSLIDSLLDRSRS